MDDETKVRMGAVLRMVADLQSRPTQLRVSRTALGALKDRLGVPADTGPRGRREALYGMPVVVDETLDGARWQLRAGETVVSAGELATAPAEMTVVAYVPGSGFVCVSDELAGEWAAAEGVARHG